MSESIRTEGMNAYLNGNDHRTVDIYDQEPIKHLPVGTEFYVTLDVPGLVMVSKDTGFVADSAAAGEFPMLYQGKPIGFASERGAVLLSRIMEKGYTINLNLEVAKPYDDEHPHILACWPSNDELKDFFSVNSHMRKA